MEQSVILLSLAMPSRRNLDILEWLQIQIGSPNLSHDRLRHHGIRGAKHGYSRSLLARNLLETHARHVEP